MPFPDTPILDNFNRANEVLTTSPNWLGPLTTASSDLRVVSNVCKPGTFSSSCYWFNEFGGHSQAYMTVTVTSGAVQIFARMTQPGSGTVDGYRVNISDGSNNIALHRIDNGAATLLESLSTGAALANGDSFGIECDGSNIKSWKKPVAGSWTLYSNIADATYTTGFIGLQLDSVAGLAIDDFGGGSISLPVVPNYDQFPPYKINR